MYSGKSIALVQAAHFDSDNLLDLAISEINGPVSIAGGDAGGSFGSPVAVPGSPSGILAIFTPANLVGTSSLDLVVMSYFSQQLFVLEHWLSNLLRPGRDT